MNYLGGIIGAVIGGLIGAAVWAGLAYGLHVEVGWVAIGVGALVGLGMRLGCGDGGVVAGLIAVAVAITALLAGKWATVQFAMEDIFDPDALAIAGIADVVVAEREEADGFVGMPTTDPDSIADVYPKHIWQEALSRWNDLGDHERDRIRELPLRANPDYILSYIADDIVMEGVDQGREIQWPEGRDFESAWREADYPEDVWAEAVAALEGMSPEDRADYETSIDDYLRSDYQMDMAGFQAEIAGAGFAATFSPVDFLWFGLAVIAAFKVGMGDGE